MVLVDTNVLLDVVGDDPKWANWSHWQLDAIGLKERLCIDPVIYSELSIAFERIEELDHALAVTDITVLLTIPREALFLAGKAFLNYRRRAGSTRTGVLPDFFIGAHAAVTEMPILTRDDKRYRSYFPTVQLITP
jgi:predicted nucleic acid-binding protein